jgi:hypothetical protein
VTLVSATLIVAVENARRGPVTNALSHRASTYLGRVSYGTYLWHWPVIVVLTRETSLGSFPVFLLACAIATSFAAASYHVIELPVRRSPRLDRYALPVIACGLALSALGGLVVVPAILGTKHSSTLVARGSGQVDPTALDWRAAKDDIPPLPECTLDHPSSCTIVRGTGPHILLMGDSNARMWIPTFSRIAQREHLSLSVAAAPLCPWQRGLYYLLGIDTCKARQADWYGGLLDELDPDIVVVADRPIDDPANAVAVGNVFGAQQPGASGFEPLLQRTSAKSIDALRADGRKVVILEPIPISTEAENPLNCLSSASTVDQCVYEANTARTPLEQYYASAAVPGAVWSFDLDRVVCPRLPKCDPVVNGIITKRDSDHITATYAAAIADQVDARLKAAGLLPRN